VTDWVDVRFDDGTASRPEYTPRSVTPGTAVSAGRALVVAHRCAGEVF
jgi:hypothetical protein